MPQFIFTPVRSLIFLGLIFGILMPLSAQAAATCDGMWRSIDPAAHGQSIVGVYVPPDRSTQAVNSIATTARGDNNCIYSNWYNFGSGTWTGWREIPGWCQVTSAPSSYVGSALNVLAQGGDFLHHHIVNWVSGWDTVNQHTDPSPHLPYGTPTVATDGQGRPWEFRSAGTLQYKCGFPSASSAIPEPASDAICPAGQVFRVIEDWGVSARDVAAVEHTGGDDHLVVAVRGMDNNIWVKEWKNKALKNWYVIGGPVNTRQKLVKESGQLWLYAQGLDGVIHKISYLGPGVWSGWQETGISNDQFGAAGPTSVATSWGTFQMQGTDPLSVAQCVRADSPESPRDCPNGLRGYVEKDFQTADGVWANLQGDCYWASLIRDHNLAELREIFKLGAQGHAWYYDNGWQMNCSNGTKITFDEPPAVSYSDDPPVCAPGRTYQVQTRWTHTTAFPPPGPATVPGTKWFDSANTSYFINSLHFQYKTSNLGSFSSVEHLAGDVVSKLITGIPLSESVQFKAIPHEHLNSAHRTGLGPDNISRVINPPFCPEQLTADIKANGSDGPISIPYNSVATLTWISTNATSCSVSPGGWTGTSGSQSTGNLTVDRTYTLNCTGPGGSANDSVTVNVIAPQPLSVILTANPSVGDVPFTSTLTAMVQPSGGTYRYAFQCNIAASPAVYAYVPSFAGFTAATTATTPCPYNTRGTFTARVVATRQSDGATAQGDAIIIAKPGLPQYKENSP